MWLLVPLLGLFCICTSSWPDPKVRTKGHVWPQPQLIQYAGIWSVSNKFNIAGPSESCDITKKAVERYTKLINARSLGISEKEDKQLTGLRISVLSTGCPLEPQLGMDESYKLQSDDSVVTLIANEVWGVLRGLESFSQLFFHDENQLFYNAAIIRDFPRFPHRGLLLDTSRHYFSVKIIKAIIELMAANKLNVFHWHIVDNEAFPYVSEVYPELAQGAYTPNHIYTHTNVKDIIAFARTRGIRVIPEFDTPGHTASWRIGIDSMTTRCYNKNGTELGAVERAMLDITKQETWDTITALFKETFELFPDHYFHLGGDETEFWMESCWLNNKNVTEFMHHWHLSSAKDVEQWYFNQLLQNLRARDMKKKTFMVWQEVLDMGLDLKASVVGHVWKGNTNKEQMDKMAEVVRKGHYAVLSSCWYLDHLSWNADYKDYYRCDPTGFRGTIQEHRLVLGGEAAMWGEMVDATNVIPRIFPRASAVAEKLWSDAKFTNQNPELVWPRLLEMQCRMVKRGYPAQPSNGPSYCETEYDPNLPVVD